MSNFIEVNSTYRDRNLWPIPGEFEIPISQTGIKNNKNEAIDSVSLSEPLVSWTPNDLSFNENIYSGNFYTNSDLQYASYGNSFIIYSQAYTQIKQNYFSGLSAFIPAPTTLYLYRIKSSRFLGYKEINNVLSDLTEFIFDINIPEFSPGIGVIILDSTNLNDLNYPLFYVPYGRNQDNAYSNYILYNENINDWREVTTYDGITHIISCKPIDTDWKVEYISYNIRKEPPLIPFKKGKSFEVIGAESNLNIIVVDISPDNTVFSKEKDFYKNYFLRLRPVTYNLNYGSESRVIISYNIININKKVKFEVYPSFNKNIIDFNAPPVNGIFNIIPYTIEILPFSYDNFSPFNYTGTLVQQSCCYEIELINLILPNQILSVGEGNKIAFYPYIYVELTNITSANSGYNNTIYSNNPNAAKMVFRIPVYDVQDPESTPFVRLISSNMTQVLKFKPDDNLLFSVRLSNGEIYNTIVPEFYSPSIPNPQVQISAIFRLKKII
jgi:hypothetical protein